MQTEKKNRFSKGRRLLLLGLVITFLLYLTGCASTAYRSSRYVSSELDDVEYLSAYGEWYEVEPYGMVWQPFVVANWSPFYHGHWIWTTDGWVWTSYEPYGWLVYHYGSWGYQPWIGWFWVPGNVWSPARVQWYTYEDYTAWAPFPPPGIVWLDPWDPYDVNVWVVVDINNFTNEEIGKYRVLNPQRQIVQRSTVARKPPEIKRVERVSKREVPTRNVETKTVRVHRKTVSDRSKSAESRDSTLKRIVLPKSEKQRVERHKTTVEREVLRSDRSEPARQKSTTGRNQQKEPRKK